MIDILREYNFWDGRPVLTGLFRESYTSWLQHYLGARLIKVVVGQRRSGKSYLFRMLINHLMSELKVPPNNILYINKDISALDFIQNDRDLQSVIDTYKAQMRPQGKCYLFFDEIQQVRGWEKIVNSFSQDYTREYEVFITGSNANLISSELATLLSGRYVTLEVFPFSYSESLKMTRHERNKDSFIEYLKHGGIPETFIFKTKESIANYVESLKDSIVLRDIVQRHGVKDIALLKRIIDFAIDTVGSLLSINSIVKALQASGIKTNVETVGSYFEYLRQAFFLHESARYDLKGKKILQGERKYYLNDLAFKFFTTSSFDFSIGKYLENAIFLHYKRQGYTISTGKLPVGEVDFVMEKAGNRIYVQAAYLLSDESVIEREFGNLEKIDDNYEKLVVTLDDVDFGNRKGIRHVRAWELIGEAL